MYVNWLAEAPQNIIFWEAADHKIGKLMLQLRSENVNLCEEILCFCGAGLEQRTRILHLWYWEENQNSLGQIKGKGCACPCCALSSAGGIIWFSSQANQENLTP